MQRVGRGVKPANGEVELDLGRYELRRMGRRVRLEKKPMELLIFLISRRDQMVSREDIVKKLWHSDPLIDTERNVSAIWRSRSHIAFREAAGTGAGNAWSAL